MPRDSAQSSTPPTSAPDCDRKASLPGFGFAMPKLALTPSAGTQMPRQFGPMMRRQVGRAASSILWRSSGPSPAVMTTAARVPFLPSAAIRPGTVSGGVAMTREVRRLGQLVDVWIGVVSVDPPVLGIDEIDRSCESRPPAYSPVSFPPTEPPSALAPIIAIERGRKAYSRLRMVIGGSSWL